MCKKREKKRAKRGEKCMCFSDAIFPENDWSTANGPIMWDHRGSLISKECIHLLCLCRRKNRIYIHISSYIRDDEDDKNALFWPHIHFSSPKYTHFREGVEYICTYDNIILIRVVDFILYVYFYVYVCVFLLYTALWSLSFSFTLVVVVHLFFLHYYRLCICMKARIYFHNAHFIHYNMFGLFLSLLLCVRVDFLFLISHFVAVVVVWWGHHSHFYNSVERSEWWRKEKRREREIRWDEL